MSTKTYTKAIQDIFREVNGDDEDTEIETEEAERQESNFNKRYFIEH